MGDCSIGSDRCEVMDSVIPLTIENLERFRKLSDKYAGFWRLEFTFFDLLEWFGQELWSWRKLFETDEIRIISSQFNLDKIEKEFLIKALEITGYNQKDAAKLLGISARQVYSRVVKYKIIHSGWKKNREVTT